MKPVFEVEEVPGVLDASKPVPNWAKSETTPRTGIVAWQQSVTPQLESDAHNSAALMGAIRKEIAEEVGALVMARIGDGRVYSVVATWHEDRASPHDPQRPNWLLLGLRAIILLRHWQDAQIGEDVVADAITDYSQEIVSLYELRDERKAVAVQPDDEKPVPYPVSVELEEYNFQQIRAEGRTLCWRRVA